MLQNQCFRKTLVLLLFLQLFYHGLSFVRTSSDTSSDENDAFNAFNSSGKYTSLEAQYYNAQKLVTPASSVREFRKGVAILEEITRGNDNKVGRISADAMADLSYLYLFGSHGKNAISQSPSKAFHLANQSAHYGSPKGRHLMSFLLRVGIGIPGVPGMIDTEAASWSMELLAAEQNHLPAMMSVAYRYLFHQNDCESAVRLYRAAATTAVGRVDATFFGDYASLRSLSPIADELGDDLIARLARDAETVDYWQFHAERKEGRALYEIGKMYQLGLWGTVQNLATAVGYYRRAASIGHTGAQGELGRLLTIGHGCELNLGFALKFLRQAVAAASSHQSPSLQGSGDHESPFRENSNAANDRSAGLNGDASYLGGTINAEEYAEEREFVAAATLGSLLNKRVFESEDADMGSRLLRQAAAAGSDDAEWELGQAELRDGRLDAAIQHFQRASKRDHVRSMLALAQVLELNGVTNVHTLAGNVGNWGAGAGAHGATGNYPAKNDDMTCRAVARLYKRVAEVGPWLDGPYGPRQAARELRAGRESEALLMYLLAAGEGYEIPHYNAAWMLIRNKGTGSSGISSSAISSSAAALRNHKYSIALQLLQSLIIMNPSHSWASLLEGDLHYRGLGTTRNMTAAAHCYDRSASSGNPLAMERLAVQLLHGSGVRQDDLRARQLIKLALARITQPGGGGSGLRGLAMLVKYAELLYRLTLMSIMRVLRAALSGKWIGRLIWKSKGISVAELPHAVREEAPVMPSSTESTSASPAAIDKEIQDPQNVEVHSHIEIMQPVTARESKATAGSLYQKKKPAAISGLAHFFFRPSRKEQQEHEREEEK